jgi:hypothetical protein
MLENEKERGHGLILIARELNIIVFTCYILFQENRKVCEGTDFFVSLLMRTYCTSKIKQLHSVD